MNCIVLSDLHLDRNQSGQIRNGEYVRIQDGLNSLNDVVDYCAEKNIEQVFITGDTFHSTRPSAKMREYLYNWVFELTNLNIEVVFILGNHDMSRNKLNRHNLTDLHSLKPKNVHVVEEYELLSYDDFDVAAISWSFNDFIPEFDIKRPTLCICHASVFDNEPLWENGANDYQINKGYFNQFTWTVLGHIHTYNVIQETPLIMYPGSLQASKWGDGDDMGFIHITEDGWEHVRYNLRPRKELKEFPKTVDSETIYRFIYKDNDFHANDISYAFSGCFHLDIKNIRTDTSRETRFENDMKDMSETEVLKAYFELEGGNYGDLEELWMEIYQE